ncbi:riboflavin kinase, partial [Claviceps digitariae]
LGIPTANLPVDTSLTPWIESIPSGVYFGYASLLLPEQHPQRSPDTGSSSSSPFGLFPMVMSIGYNPFYKNTVRSAEVHILHAFTADFYGAHMRLLILGFIREERDYESLAALVEDIEMDCRVARGSLEREGWRAGAVMVKGAKEEEKGEGEEKDGAEWLLRKL